MLSKAIVSLLALASTAVAKPLDVSILAGRDKECENTPTTRSCWKDGYSIATDWDEKIPDTGVTRKYVLNVAENTLSPDGFTRPMMSINGGYPGPTLTADWGDWFEITVNNNLKTNGTSIHWHGIRQFGTNSQDGTNGVTECPQPPGTSKKYYFRAAAYGTSWYHSHYSGQYGDGVVGGIVINGPTTANYDIDLGFYSLTDWFHRPFFQVNAGAAHSPGPPVADNALINGTMKLVNETSKEGSYAKTILTPGKKHLLRLANVGINNYMHVALDGHQFTIVSADFVAVNPTTVDSLVLAVGQRYEVIIEAKAEVKNYWFRLGPGNGLPIQTSCDGPNAQMASGNTKAIFSYEGADDQALPDSTPAAPLPTGCYDQAGLVPYFKQTIPSKELEPSINATFSNVNGGTVQWLVDGSAMSLDLGKPTLQYIADGQDPPEHYNVLKIGGDPTNFNFWHIQWVAPTDGSPNALVPHPIHLHGHDFYVLGSGPGPYSGQPLNLDNPTRRDTATLPLGGWLILGFPTDNPGAWLMHCHIPYHVTGGLAKQFIENADEIDRSQYSHLKGECDAWNAAKNGFGYTQPFGDSGL